MKRNNPTAKAVFLLPIATAFLAATLIPSVTPITVSANTYNYSSGAGASTFGNATSTDALPQADATTQNTRRNKDAALTPPPFGVFGGEIETAPISPYYSVDTNARPANSGGLVTQPVGGSSSVSGSPSSVGVGGTVGSGGAMLPPTSLPLSTEILPSTSEPDNFPLLDADIPLSAYKPEQKTPKIAPLFYQDGSIGTLTIEKLGKTLTVYEGETLENMAIGVGHFSSTSAWDSNAAFAAHNSGSAPHFAFVKDLSKGDKITYSTLYGERLYVVTEKAVISDTDLTALNISTENTITLITCVEGKPALRLKVTAAEVK